MFALSNVMRDYPWGSATAIAGLLGTEPSGGPEAELWMGAHPDSPSTASTPDGGVALDALIAAHPDTMLGAEVRAAFGDRLPFLTKLLAADRALSLQVHPTLERARERFADEEASGILRRDAARNYKDDNHKPEMLFALSNFEALCGFRPCASAAGLFREVAEAISATGAAVPPLLAEVSMALNSRMVEPMVVRKAFELLIGGGADASALVELAASALSSAGSAGTATASGGLSAPLRTVVELQEQYPGDPGVLISLLLNRVSLVPGQAVYLPAGNIHAYLSGLGLEVMASSDNVLRGGLTGKHVDVPELLATVDFAPTSVPFVPTRTTELGQEVFEPPFAEFALQRVELAPGGDPVPLVQNGPLLVLAVSGSVLLDSPRGDMVLARGGSVFVPAVENPVMVHPAADSSGSPAVVFAVTVAGQPS
ncbi:mannose-6-phosphate isomerase [Arthrobacter silviterrae]|uniref:mannose-6-phosphate isomerase n=1 Tax=Arthrobacter silviterrae TaxID=2026658 RepID=A0ABX0DAI1_9MICC|nr:MULTISPECIES: mannose-6-phosphate isomerase, class I [Arthrobacter]MCU6481680.1 mannose-6-phosphate isomerase, class I [Arthrobacter sp. A2-55]MDQ0279203.1 mannose-6-phosphate isomerase [Arthrobacter silviterrae]NGN83678.1 mannose-6-phosphate isomerase, class I [Arthrobacter silviterrae]